MFHSVIDGVPALQIVNSFTGNIAGKSLADLTAQNDLIKVYTPQEVEDFNRLDPDATIPVMLPHHPLHIVTHVHTDSSAQWLSGAWTSSQFCVAMGLRYGTV